MSTSEERPAGVSAVVPVYNEIESLPRLHEQLSVALASTGRDYEIVYADDGSRDGSADWLEELTGRDPAVTVVQLARNFGQTAAMSAGIDEATHDIVVTLDADLQNDPADIGLLLSELDAGADVASGWRKDRHDSFLTRTLPSKVANGLVSLLTGVKLHDFGCSLKAYRRRLFESFRLYGEMHRFVPVYCAWAGGKVVEVEVRHHARTTGSSKYGLGRTWRVILDLLTLKFLLDFGTKPLHLFGSVGLLSCAAGVAAGATTLVQKYFDPEAFVHRNPLILLAIFLFLLGVQSVMLGLLAEIGIRTYHEARGAPAHVVRRVIGGSGAKR
jgi:glycosyltransferase involved in cell wall biosynthesis